MTPSTAIVPAISQPFVVAGRRADPRERGEAGRDASEPEVSSDEDDGSSTSILARNSFHSDSRSRASSVSPAEGSPAASHMWCSCSTSSSREGLARIQSSISCRSWGEHSPAMYFASSTQGVWSSISQGVVSVVNP
jgi:hypothetical protein